MIFHTLYFCAKKEYHAIMNICEKAKGCPRASKCIHGNRHGTKDNCGIRGCFFAGDTGKVSCVEYKKKVKKPAAKKPRDYIESRLQAEIVQALSLMGVFVMMVPNGEITDMSARKYTRLVAMGFRLGAPDLLLFARKENRFFGMELKKPGGTQSPGQITFQEKCVQNNWPYMVVDSLDAAIEAARGWGLCR